MPAIVEETTSVIDPMISLGVDFISETGDQSIGECPWCEKQKLHVSMKTGKWDCKVCGKSGNPLTFLRQLWATSEEMTTEGEHEELAHNRGLLRIESLKSWGIVKSFITGEWLIPTFSTGMNVQSLYRYTRFKKGEKPKCSALKGASQGLFGVQDFNEKCTSVHLCEGVWDAIAWWECLHNLSKEGKFTKSEKTHAATYTSVLAVPGTNVFRDEWVKYFSGREVVLLYDSDKPKKRGKKVVDGAGLAGMKKVTGKLTAAHSVPNSINYLYWGPEGYSKKLDEGADIRDVITPIEGKADRARVVGGLLHRQTRPVPEEWVREQGSEDHIDAKRCSSWNDLVEAWKTTLTWTEGLDRALSVMLASVISTAQTGDQLWVQVMGPPACGKSTLCEALSVSKTHTYATSVLRGFHSGFKSDRDGTEDNSLITKANGKTFILKDGDTLLSAPNLHQILAEARDIYDRVSRTSYRNAIARSYEGIELTWILCGTSALRQLDSAELGARFLSCVIMESIDEKLEDSISMNAARQALMAVKTRAGKGRQDPEQRIRAKALTGGFVDYLRENAEELIDSVQMPDKQLRTCVDYAKMVAFARARPSTRQKEKEERELSTRLTSQLVRLATCLASVLGKTEVDTEVMRRVRRVMLDTAHGQVLEIIRRMHKSKNGMDLADIANHTGEGEEATRGTMRFLRKIKCAETFKTRYKSGLVSSQKWRLKSGVRELFERVILNNEGD